MPRSFQALNNINDFCKQAEENPLRIYLEMLDARRESGDEFSFPPFRSVLDYLAIHCKSVTDFDKKHQELLEGAFPFLTTSVFIHKCLHILDGKEFKRDDTDYIATRAGCISFGIATNSELSLPFFSFTRAVPIFVHGVSCIDQKYDGDFYDKNTAFYRHDETHKWYQLRHLEEYLDDKNLRAYPVLDCTLFSTFIKKCIKSVQGPLKYAIELLLFESLHELAIQNHTPTQGQWPKVNIYKRSMEPNFSNPPDKHYYIWEPLDLAAGMFSCAKQVQSGFRGYIYPEEYSKNSARILEELAVASDFLTDAASWYAQKKPSLGLEMDHHYLTCQSEQDTQSKLLRLAQALANIEALADEYQRSDVHHRSEESDLLTTFPEGDTVTKKMIINQYIGQVVSFRDEDGVEHRGPLRWFGNPSSATCIATQNDRFGTYIYNVSGFTIIRNAKS